MSDAVLKRLRHPATGKITFDGNKDCIDNLGKVREIYNFWRDKGYSIEETFYLICSAANSLVMEEGIRGRRAVDDKTGN